MYNREANRVESNRLILYSYRLVDNSAMEAAGSMMVFALSFGMYVVG